MPEALKRKPYQGEYRQQLEEPIETPIIEEPVIAPEEVTWKTRYGDLRRHQSQLTEENKTLKTQLQAAQKKEIQIPSTKEELEGFAQRYPDVMRHIRSIALQEFLGQKQDLELETNKVREELQSLTREASEKKIRAVHPDFDEIIATEDFHNWAQTQSKTIQNMLFDSDDPQDCIDGINIFKAVRPTKPIEPKPRSTGADTLVRNRTPQDQLRDDDGQRVWKASEIGKMHPTLYERHEQEIEQARREGRIDMNA